MLVVDEVGYIPFDPEAANLMFSLVSARYERASMIVTSNKPFCAWGEIFGDEVVAVAMIDRLVHHSEILSLKGDSYRLRDKDLGARASAEASRNRLTDHLRAPRRGPQTGSEGLVFELSSPEQAGIRARRAQRLSPTETEPTRGRDQSNRGGQFSTGGASPRVCAGGPLFNRRKWPTFQPALTRARFAWAKRLRAVDFPELRIPRQDGVRGPLVVSRAD